MEMEYVMGPAAINIHDSEVADLGVLVQQRLPI